MTQNWTDDVFASSHNAQTDLQNMENNFLSLKSLFAGSTAPANTVAGMPWFDTGSDLLYIRNAANASWYGLMHADASQQIWIYRNDALSGWVIVSTVADTVLAIKGGTNAYNVVGGSAAGTWQQDEHTLVESEIPSHVHNVSEGAAGYHSHGISAISPSTGGATDGYSYKSNYQGIGGSSTSGDGSHSHTISESSIGGDAAHDHGSSWRPAAAVGTLQRMDV